MKRSPLETLLAYQMRMMCLPTWEEEYKAVVGRKFRWDFAWPGHKLLVEVQGGIWRKGGHSTGKGIERDAEKMALAVAGGWRQINVTATQIRSGEASRWIKQALEAIA